MDLSKKIDGKKYMWDGEVYASEGDADQAANEYGSRQFETRVLNEDGQFLVYNRKVVDEVIVEGQ